MSKAPPLPKTFEDAMQELERIVEAMESEQLPLEQSLGHYQRGMQLMQHCQQTLDAAESRIRVLQDGALRTLSQSAAEDKAGTGEPT